MASNFEEIEKHIFELSNQQRADLVKKILLSLEHNDLDDDIADLPFDEKIWIEEVIRRSEDYKSGKVEGIPWDKALKDLKEKFK